jgi:hypothetical protein
MELYHNILTYGLFVGCVTKGLVGHPHCGPTIKFQSSTKLKKVVYCRNSHYLLRNHPYWQAQGAFNGETYKSGCTHSCNNNIHHKMGQRMRNMVIRFKK